MFYLVGIIIKDKTVSLFIKDDKDNTIDKVSKSDIKFALYNGMEIKGISYDKANDKIDLGVDYIDKNIYELSDNEYNALDKIITGSNTQLGIHQGDWDLFVKSDTGELITLSEGLGIIRDNCTKGLDSYDLTNEEKKAVNDLNKRYSLDIGNNIKEESALVGDLDEYALDMESPSPEVSDEIVLDDNLELDTEHEKHEDSEESEDENTSTVSLLYKKLTEDQLAVLRRYYLWYSQRVIEIAGGKGCNTSLHANTKKMKAKRDALNKLKKTGGTWAYAGFIDTGYHGGDHCAFGHALRYLHIAWDVEKSDIEEAFFGIRYNKRVEKVLEDEANNAIKFGIKCVGDFFDIDPSYKQFLQATQRETLKDMGTLYQYYSDGTQDEINSSFTVMDNLLKYVNISSAKNVLRGKPTVIDAGTTQFYMQCRETGLVPPKSLVQLVRDSIIGWDKHKFTRDLGKIDLEFFLPVMNGIFGGKFNNLINFAYDRESKYKSMYSVKRALRYYIDTYFMYKVCGAYEYNATKESKDEGGASEPMRRALSEKYYFIKRTLWSDLDYSVEYLMKIDTFMNLTTMFNKEDFESVYTYNLIDDLYVVDRDTKKLDNIAISKYASEKDNGFDTSMNLVIGLTDGTYYGYNSNVRRVLNSSIDAAIEEIKSAIDNINKNREDYLEWSVNRVQKICDERNEFYQKEKEKKLLETKLKEEQEKASKQEKLNEIEELKKKDVNKLSMKELLMVLNNTDLSTLPVTFNKHKMILDTINKYKDLNKVSRAQKYNLEQLYNYITGKTNQDDITNDKINLEDRKDLVEAIDYALSHKTEILGVEGVTDFNLKVATSVKYRGTISEKQLKYIEAILDAYNQIKGI